MLTYLVSELKNPFKRFNNEITNLSQYSIEYSRVTTYISNVPT